jgi:hypothetical protein
MRLQKLSGRIGRFVVATIFIIAQYHREQPIGKLFSEFCACRVNVLFVLPDGRGSVHFVKIEFIPPILNQPLSTGVPRKSSAISPQMGIAGFLPEGYFYIIKNQHLPTCTN